MIVDIIIIVIMILAIILGKKKGLTVCLVNFLSLIIALIVALMLCKPVGNYIMEKTPVGNNLKETIKQNIPMGEGEIKLDAESNLPEGIKNYINEQTKGVNEAKNSGIEAVSTELAKDIVTAISFIGIFIIVKAALLIVKVVSKLINKLPILKQIDGLGGAICGAVQGVIIIYCILAVISIISPVIENTKIVENINNSHIGKTMYNNNIVVKKLYNK